MGAVPASFRSSNNRIWVGSQGSWSYIAGIVLVQNIMYSLNLATCHHELQELAGNLIIQASQHHMALTLVCKTQLECS